MTALAESNTLYDKQRERSMLVICSLFSPEQETLLIAFLEEALKKLQPDERQLVELLTSLRDDKPPSQESVARRLGMSVDDLRRVYGNALWKLQMAFKNLRISAQH